MSGISRRNINRGALSVIGLCLAATALPAGASTVLLASPASAATSSVVPIDFSSLTQPTDAVSNQVVTVLRNSNKFAVTTWWDTTKNYDAQTGAYLDFGGTGENNIRPGAAQVFGLATALSMGVYSPTQTGVTKAAAEAMTVKLISSLAYRHKVNLGSTGWGDHWQSAHWTAFAGTAGWLMWDKLSTTDRENVRKMVEYEANRYNNYQPGYYRNADGTYASPGDTKAEEVAWNNTVLALAASMMPDHANKTTWMKQVVALSLKANSRPSDVGTGVDAWKSVNGFQLGSMAGSNVNQDGTVVNHDLVHPDYMESFAINLSGALTLGLSKQDTPYAVRRSYDRMYDALVDLNFPAGTMPYTDPKMAGKTFRAPGGKIYAGTNTNPTDNSDIYYPMGNDWGTSRRMQFATMDVFADSFKEDGLASVKGATWAAQHLNKVQKMQERSADRRTYTSAGEDNYPGREEWVSHHAAWAYLARVISSNGMYNVTQAAY
ncbi:hypothetical protein OG259_37670 [Streptomyces sp. NBC_00250]|uniref:hypothetical protein n=1 Tax=Streptomyces sp. NBC_00250 TaxID=2903641 RepID=UPI002E2C0B8D|nr:hypothetical protein [Streptomyces sp. NBC_00250]